MSEEDGVVSVAPEVIITIAKRTATDVQGVARLIPQSSTGVGRMFRGTAGDGVSVAINEEEAVTVDLNVVADADANVVDLGKKLQNALKRAIEEIVGMHVEAINVNVEDVTFASSK